MSKAHYNVYWNGSSWVTKKHGNGRVSKSYDTQGDARQGAHDSLRTQGGGELTIHGRNGRIRQKTTVPKGNDPRNIPG